MSCEQPNTWHFHCSLEAQDDKIALGTARETNEGEERQGTGNDNGIEPAEDPPDNSKPVARRGRKATGQVTNLTAGLPKEGYLRTPGNLVVLRAEAGNHG